MDLGDFVATGCAGMQARTGAVKVVGRFFRGSQNQASCIKVQPQLGSIL